MARKVIALLAFALFCAFVSAHAFAEQHHVTSTIAKHTPTRNYVKSNGSKKTQTTITKAANMTTTKMQGTTLRATTMIAAKM